MGTWNIINLSDIRPDRADAEYFHIDYSKNIEKLSLTGQVTTLGRIFKKVDRGEKAAYLKEGPIPVLRSVNIRELDFNEIRQEYVSDDYYAEKARGRVLKDDILITSTGTGTLGRTSIWPTDNKAFNVPENSFLRDPINVDPYMVAAFLNTDFGIQQLFQNQRGSSGQLHLYPVDIKRVVIPECLFPYQEEIGEKVRRAFELQSLSKELYQEAMKSLSESLALDSFDYNKNNHFIASYSTCVSERIIDSKFHNPKFKQITDFLSSKFDTIELRKIAAIEYGYMPMQDYETNPEKGIPLIRVTNITQELEIKLDDLKYIPNWVKVPAKKFVEQGDILIVQCGDTTGKVGYIYEEVSNHLFPSFCFSIKVNDTRINSLFLAALLKTELMQDLFDQTVMINTVRPNTTKPRFEKMLIPIFDMSYQLEISNLLIRSNQAKKESKELLKQARKQVEELIEQSIQANA